MAHTRYGCDAEAGQSTPLLASIDKKLPNYGSSSTPFSFFKTNESQKAQVDCKYKGGFKPSEKLLKLMAEKTEPLVKHSI